MHKPIKTSHRLPGRQRGALTMFSAVMILLLLTELIIYAVSGGVIEQTKSANDMRQKLALHAAESGLNHGKEFFIANRALVVSTVTDLLPDGTDGWLSAGAEHWISCAGVTTEFDGGGSHPCYAEGVFALREASYYYSFGGSTELPVDTDAIIPGTTEQVAVQALLCMTEMDFTIAPGNPAVVQGCTTNGDFQNEKYFVITLLARGEADCDAGTGNCFAEALIVEKIAGTSPGSGGTASAAPLITKSTFPPSGTAQIVPNPNGMGDGVPLSAWLNNNSMECGAAPVVDAEGGSWENCEREEWYGLEDFPDDYACTFAQCSCKESESDKLLSSSADETLNFDIVLDEDFPCDLFAYVFGIDKDDEDGIAGIKGMATVIDDCGILDENSTGMFWATGELCDIKVRVGSYQAPVLLISAATLTSFNAGAEIFGLVFVTDAEDLAAEIKVNGNATVYGQVYIDAAIALFNGTFQVVYLESVIERALGLGTFGVMAGGWTDFHRDWQ